MKLAYLLVALWGLLFSTAAYSQGVGTSGEITGTVVDQTGALIVKASVIATDTAKGIQHNTVTDESGHYRFSGLPPAVYNVTVESQGLAPETRKDVTVILGETTILNLQMHMANVASNVEVTAESEAPVVDVERASQAGTLDQRYINGLPIDRRDYLSFSLLMPGVSESLTIADNRDLRAREVPQSGLSLYGSNGRGNNVTVDGGNFNGYSQFVMANVSQDAVQEFQINRANYSAVLGGANGASVNIVTKTGTNVFHGSLYGFFRNDALDARDPFAFAQALTPAQPFSLNAQGQPVKNSLSRQQFGGTMGFPLKKEKTFMFVAYEGLLQDKQASVPLLTNSNIFGPQSGQEAIINGLLAQGATPVPCNVPTLPATMSAAACAGVLQNALTIDPASNPLNAFLVNQFETNGGLLPFPITTHQGSVRLDHQINDWNQTSLRYIVAHLEESNPSVQSLSGFSNGFSELQWTSSLQASWLHTFNATTLNEARVQWNINQYNLIPNTMGETNLAVTGFGNFGQNLTLPNISTERDYEFADNLDKIHGKHIFQMGIDEILRGNRTANFGFMGGEFSFGELPGGILSTCLQAPSACGVASGPATINAMQSFSMGLPQAYIQGFGNPTVVTQMPLTSLYLQDDWSLRSNLSLHLGVRYEIDKRAFIHTSYNNFAPRASFSWDPFGDHKTVVRGGYGIYYSPIILQVDTVTAQYGGQGNRQLTSFVVPLNGLPGNPAANSAAIFQSLFGAGKISCGQPAAGNPGCITPADLVPFGINVSNSGPLPPFAITFNTSPDFRNPYSQQASLGVERELAPGLSIAANYIYVHSVHLARSTDVNVLPGAPITANVPGTNGLPFQNWGAPQCQVAINNPCFANPLLFSDNVFSSTAGAVYQGGTLELKKRFSHHFTMLANYTYSKSMDDSPDFTYWSNNQVQTASERALSSFDQRHRIVMAAVIDSPFHSRVLKGFELAPIVEYRSPHPFNLYAGADVNGDRTDFADRPPGAGRNTGIGPEYANTSLRLSRRFRINEAASIQLTAEAFNLLNRTNYSRVNGEVGPAFAAPFDVHGNSQLLPNQPLGFTADYPKREIQLGARFSF